MKNSPKTRVALFLIVTFALSVIFYWLIIAKGIGGFGGILVLGLMWCPALGAIVTRLVTQKNLRGIGIGLGGRGAAGIKYLVAAYLLPVAVGLAVYGAVWLSGLGGFNPERFMGYPAGAAGAGSVFLRTLAIQLTVVFGFSVLSAFGEELGWRGLLVPELAKMMSYGKLVLLSAFIWALYHYPIILFSGYRSTAPLWYATIMFTLDVFAISFIFAWLRLRSGSVWPAVVLHASHNLIIQRVFDVLTTDRGPTSFITSEFGIGLVVAYGAVALWCWRHRGDLPISTVAR